MIASESGDPIGGGTSKVYRSPTDTIEVRYGTDGRLHFAAGLRTDGNAFEILGYSADFIGPTGMTPLAMGYYGGLQRFPFHDPQKGGLDIEAGGFGCNTLNGWFTIDNIAFSGSDITALDLRFEQHGDGAVPALHGAIHWTR